MEDWEKTCIYNKQKICDNCGECRCDLDPDKICDNCMECVNGDAHWRAIAVEGFAFDQYKDAK